ncbi:alpha/beta hydrolase [Glacieibacterium megasporae]|uniref:alpha/beta hydrolase n=1 Tax=Glacieibacterium megasporae TaxID=2835787 RepID=UPI001C1DD095|nr:alpha/beta hydrolase-fold protein [Polymorphobacter megasporae]UAJ10883.1 alpha/beta hydrolase [Polymorphobacter megasporae]
MTTASPFEALQPPSGHGRLFVYRDFRSRALLPRDIFVWVPDGGPGAGFSVLYMQDGQNLFDARLVPFGTAWEADRSMARLADSGAIAPAIIVGIGSTADRFVEYAPELILDRLAEPARQAIEAAWGGGARSGSYAQMVMEDIRPLIDAHFPTNSAASATFVGGSSMGAVAAAELLARYPNSFAGAALLSAHFSLLPVTGTEPLPAGFAEQVAAAVGSFARACLPPAGHHRIWLDRSMLGIDAFYPPSHAAFVAALTGLGYVEGIDMAPSVYPGVGHDEDAWRSRLDDVLGFLLAPARAAQ